MFCELASYAEAVVVQESECTRTPLQGDVAETLKIDTPNLKWAISTMFELRDDRRRRCTEPAMLASHLTYGHG